MLGELRAARRIQPPLHGNNRRATSLFGGCLMGGVIEDPFDTTPGAHPRSPEVCISRFLRGVQLDQTDWTAVVQFCSVLIKT